MCAVHIGHDLVIEPSKGHVDDDFASIARPVRENVVENFDKTGEVSLVDVVERVNRVAIEVVDDDKLSIFGQSKENTVSLTCHLSSMFDICRSCVLLREGYGVQIADPLSLDSPAARRRITGSKFLITCFQ